MEKAKYHNIIAHYYSHPYKDFFQVKRLTFQRLTWMKDIAREQCMLGVLLLTLIQSDPISEYFTHQIVMHGLPLCHNFFYR